MTFDEIRRHYSTVGFAVYALDGAAGGVTLELHPPVGEMQTYTAPDLETCLRSAFPLFFIPAAPPEQEPQPLAAPVDPGSLFE